MEYILRNGKSVTIRRPEVDDAEEIISVISTADEETLFLARNPGEFQPTFEEERNIIEGVLNSTDSMWLVAEVEGKIVGQCSAGLIRGYQRYRHRAGVAFVLLERYCNMGIGGKMMEECLKWCKDNNVTQVELDVIKNNERALKMYQNFGFEIVGNIPNALRYSDGTYVDEYTMVKFI
ncbi:GNAT family N-acetyltransferase [Sedimentibacter hydroxybenzoicus DSM 7310]|uniref:GNAT family N-acetyltransferase n=1 Tax=Sedimentibacter hydroxybenzoicus DSM 7310 TaxID=1123245 RepID=A0A974BKQ3_SEDHY|nr:GNAT family N-acetyltransferase [Sedimentibacter hydroxybenzoicus]NYB74656.1 GNAT family N-acetyltransferase [Sedimentibacter hydroxybenzoicus DSM 7310]